MFRERGFWRSFVVAAAIAAAVAAVLASAGGAGAKSAWNAPRQPAHDHPSADGLAGGREEAATVKSWGNGNSSKHSKGSGGNPIGAAAPGAVGSTTLILYDTTGAYGWLGELYAQYAGNLVSHFGTWKAEPVTSYQAGQIGQYTATIYIGSTYGEPLPTAFLTDVSDATRPVVWIYDNIWELSDQMGASTFASQYGWMWSQFDTSTVNEVDYKGVALTRDGADNQAGIMEYGSVDPTKASVLAWAVRADGSKFPWAIRSGELTYVGENPFVYTSETDRVLAFDDMLYDVLDPSAPTEHRAMLRLEDISLDDDPTTVMQTAEYLYSQHIPYGFEFTPIYTDPTGFYNNGVAQTVELQKHTQMADTILWMESHGGTLVAHGLTHQYSNIPNPFTAVTGDDAEFYRLIENPDHTIDYAGPIPGDSYSWASNRMQEALSIFKSAQVGTPTMWTFPDYAASVPDYQAAAALFPVRWERALYFGGYLSGGTIDYSHVIGETFPWVVRDVYGSVVLPENLGDYSPDAFYAFPAHTVDDILAAGAANLAVRNGFASFFYHPYLGLSALEQVVNGLRAQGYTFADPAQVAQTG